jgi:large subunit ribosomal protein L3
METDLMPLGLIGRKIGMTQVFLDNAEAVPVTVLTAGPCVVIQIKTSAKEGYKSIQLGYEDATRITKPLRGHFEKAGVSPKKYLREFIVSEDENFTIGEELGVDIFKKGELIDVTGTSKGKGFQGVVKRWGFHGGPAAHGSTSHRAPGSIGQASDPSRVFKGLKLPGKMGGRKVTVKNLEVVRINTEKNLLFVKGAVPGRRGSLVVIRKGKRGRSNA